MTEQENVAVVRGLSTKRQLATVDVLIRQTLVLAHRQGLECLVATEG